MQVNQHDFADDLGHLKDAIEHSPGGTLVILGEHGTPLTRVWYFRRAYGAAAVAEPVFVTTCLWLWLRRWLWLWLFLNMCL